MNRYIRIRPVLLITFIIFGIMILIYAAITVFTTVDSGASEKTVQSDSGIISGEQVPKLISENEEEREAALSAQDDSGLPAASRGGTGRTAPAAPGVKKEEPAKPAETKAAAAAEPATPAETKATATAEPAAAPATEQPKPSATPAPAQAKSAAPAEPAPAQAKPAATAAPVPVPAPKAETNTAANAVQSAPAGQASQYEKDLDLLARLITAEAQGEPYEAQVAIGAVVMNRVQSSAWPNTIKDVIYQNINGYVQFTPVSNGWIDKPAQPEAIKAAKEALNGSDPTNGAQFYYDDKCTNTWILAKSVSRQIGHMIFAF